MIFDTWLSRTAELGYQLSRLETEDLLFIQLRKPKYGKKRSIQSVNKNNFAKSPIS